MTETTVSSASRALSAPYPVKSSSVQPFDGAGMTTAQIMNILHRLDPGAVAEAGAAYTNLGDELGTMAANLAQHAQTLAQNWTGSAARAAMTSFQQLHDQTSALASQAAQTGSALTWLGIQVLPKFQQLHSPSTGPALAVGDTAVGMIGATGAGQAQEYISVLSNYLVTANTYLPDQIGGVADLLSVAGGDPETRNGTAGSSAGGSTAARGTGTPGAGGRANSRQAIGRDGAAGGAGGTRSAVDAGGTGAAAAAGAGRAGSAAGTGSAGGTSLSGSGAGGNVAGAGGTASPASPAPTVSSLQSATPVPGSMPGAAPAPVSPVPPASAGSGTADLGAGAVSPFSLVPVIPGLSGPGGGRRSGRAAASEAADPAAGRPPASPGPAVPEAPRLGHGQTGGVAPLGEVPALDGGLTGGAAQLPEAPGLNAPGTGAVDGAVRAGEVAGPSAVIADGPGAPGSGDSPGHDGLGAMPMAGGGPAQSEKERARRVWAYEDENIWGLPADCVPPVIEGG